jgi:hypothetical protein
LTSDEIRAIHVRPYTKALQYTQLSTPDTIEQVSKSTREEILAKDGEAGLVVAENAVFGELSTYLRLCIATSGGGRGAAARGACWDYLFGQGPGPAPRILPATSWTRNSSTCVLN